MISIQYQETPEHKREVERIAKMMKSAGFTEVEISNEG